MKALIIANGSKIEKATLQELIDNSDYIICADGGLDNIKGLQILPDAIIGDFDSVNDENLEEYKNQCKNIIKFDKDKDFTDTELAIIHAIKKNIKNITLVCATGTRLDHTCANIFLLEKYYEQGIKIKIIDNNNVIIFINKSLIVENKSGFYVSVLPVSDEIIGLTLKGFKYELKERNVKRGSTLCISNLIIDKTASISLKKGKALIFMSRD